MIVIPARNEGPRVGAVVRAARATFPGVCVLVVVNGCEDDTEAQAVAAGAEVLHAEPGYARAVHAGLSEARRRGAAWAVQIDGDGQHPVEAVPALLAALGGADLVVGSRFLGEDGRPARPGYAVPLARRVGVAVLSALAGVCAGQRLTDVTSGLRAWSPRALERLLPGFPAEVADGNLLVAAVRGGLRVREVPVAMRAREGGRSMHALPGALAFVARSGVATLHAMRVRGSDPPGVASG